MSGEAIKNEDQMNNTADLIERFEQFLIDHSGDFSEEESEWLEAHVLQFQSLETRVRELEGAAGRLRKAQRRYMADRGNDELGRAVGDRAKELDAVLSRAGGGKTQEDFEREQEARIMPDGMP